MHNLHAEHTHGTKGGPDTESIVLHQAGIYNLVFGSFLRRSEPTILALAGVKLGSKVLDVACGPAGLTRTAKRLSGPAGEVCGLDASPEMIDQAKKQARRAHLDIDFRVGRAEALPWEDGKFDALVSRLAWHHFPAEVKAQALVEAYRVLKPGGICVVADFELETMLGPQFLKSHVEKMHFMLRVDVQDYVPLFEVAHFEHVEAGPTGHAIISYVRGVKPARS